MIINLFIIIEIELSFILRDCKWLKILINKSILIQFKLLSDISQYKKDRTFLYTIQCKDSCYCQVKSRDKSYLVK